MMKNLILIKCLHYLLPLIKLLNIDDLVENGSSQVKLCILYNIKNQKNYSKYKVILEKYKVDNHYIIREDSKKLLKEIEL